MESRGSTLLYSRQRPPFEEARLVDRIKTYLATEWPSYGYRRVECGAASHWLPRQPQEGRRSCGRHAANLLPQEFCGHHRKRATTNGPIFTNLAREGPCVDGATTKLWVPT